MILILGKIESVTTSEESNQINLSFNDGSLHQYEFKDNNLYYIVKNTPESSPKKYITLCKDVEACTFRKENNKLITNITIAEIPYSNSFTL